MDLISQKKQQGVSLRKTFVFMLIVSLTITALLLFTTLRTIKSFHALSDAAEGYIELQDAADSLMKASDYLTEEAQRYTVLGKREHMEHYFAEAEISRRRDKAIEAMEESLPDSDALRALKEAMQGSLELMNREYYAMTLMLLAQGDGNVPEAMKGVEISAEDMALSPAQKQALARRMMHDDDYYGQKNQIRTNLDQCIEQLKSMTRGTQSMTEAQLHTDLVWVSVLIAVQSLAIILLLWVTTSLGINPILQAVEHIKHDQKLPIMGANEFRYLAGTYNNMYTVYKRSIDNLSFKASHDELTGVYNRSGYDLIRQSVDLRTTAFLLFDADRFKHINDEFGHEVGDIVLKKIAETLTANFRNDDYICRIGGDEFVVLMVHINENVRHLIEHKVKQINEDLMKTADNMPPVTVSAGVAMCMDTDNPQKMFHNADLALYHVKENGRNGCCFYEQAMPEKPMGAD